MLLKRIFRAILNRTIKKKVVQKTYESWAAKNYNPTPLVTFVLQTHNKAKNVILTIQKLRAYPNAEIIVIDDGSRKEETMLLLQELKNANEFLLRSNDLYEVITYDRAIYLAKGEFIALMQDDDDFEDLKWVDDAVGHFKTIPELAFLGTRLGLDLLPIETTSDGKRGEFEVTDQYEQRKNSFRYKIAGKQSTPEKFKFVQYVIRAPMWVNRSLFIEKIKNIDQSFAPFQWDDAEVCLHAYTLGLKVGWYKTNFNYGGGGEGGMRIWNNILHHRQDEVNAKKIYQKYGSQLVNIQEKVDNLNKEFSVQN